MEKLGTPALLVATTAFAPLAASEASCRGLDLLRVLTIEHPLAGRDTGDIEAFAQQLVGELERRISA